MDRSTDESGKIKGKLSILVVDDNVEPLTLTVIRSLGIIEDLDIHVLNLNNLTMPSFRFSRYVSSYTGKITTNDEHVFEVIREMCQKVKADIVIPVKEKTVRIVSERLNRFRDFVHIPLVPIPETLEIVRNKWLLYNWLFEKKLIKDKPLRFAEVVRSGRVTMDLTFPVLVKPYWGSGGRGIKLIRNQDELCNFKPGKEFNIEELIVQAYLPGSDIDISALLNNGEILACCIQRDIAGSEKLKYSRAIEFVHQESLLDQASLIFRELNYSGIAHLDFRFDEHEKSYQLIDFNARYWSSMLGSLKAGINFSWLHCLTALNEKIKNHEYQAGKYYITSNPIKILFSGIPFKDSEMQYALRDPISLITDMGHSILYYIRKIFKKINTIWGGFCRE